jgi:hypothetical protein
MVPTIENLINYDQWCVSFINDHRQYFYKDSAEAAIFFLKNKILFNDLILSSKQLIRFEVVARGLYKQGFWSHAGMLKDIKTNTE